MPFFWSYISRDGVYELGRGLVLIASVATIPFLPASYWWGPVLMLVNLFAGPAFGRVFVRYGFRRELRFDDAEVL